MSHILPDKSQEHMLHEFLLTERHSPFSALVRCYFIMLDVAGLSDILKYYKILCNVVKYQKDNGTEKETLHSIPKLRNLSDMYQASNGNCWQNLLEIFCFYFFSRPQLTLVI